MNPIIAVEGVSFSGKSHVCSRASHLGFKVIHDPSFYARGEFIRADTIEGALKNIFTTINIEQTRAAETRKHNEQGYGVVLDRSVFSLLALSYAYCRESAAYTDICNRVGQAIDAEEFVLPTHLILLREDIATLRQRIEKRQHTFPTFWLSEDFVEAQYKVYNEVARIYEGQGRLLQPHALTTKPPIALPQKSLKRNVLKLIGYCNKK